MGVSIRNAFFLRTGQAVGSIVWDVSSGHIETPSRSGGFRLGTPEPILSGKALKGMWKRAYKEAITTSNSWS